MHVCRIGHSTIWQATRCSDILIRFTGREIHIFLPCVAYAAVMQYALIPIRGLARAQDAGYASKFELSSAYRPNITLKSCHILAMTCTWPAVPRLIRVDRTAAYTAGLISLVRGTLLAQDGGTSVNDDA